MMQRGAKILSVQIQGDRITLWAVVDTLADEVPREINIRGTGHALRGVKPDSFIGTVQDGPYVWHVFDSGDLR